MDKRKAEIEIKKSYKVISEPNAHIQVTSFSLPAATQAKIINGEELNEH